MQRVVHKGRVYYQFDQWTGGAACPVHGVFTRLGGVSTGAWASLNVGSTVGDDPDAVSRNRHLLLAALGLESRRECTVWQVHSADTIVVNGAVPGERVLAQADGMVTDRTDVALTMRFADCVPVLLYDPVRKVIGIAHAGWRGTVIGAGPGAVRKMVEVYGSCVRDIQAGIGPSIGPARYQVGEDVVTAVQKAYGQLDGLIHRAADDSAYFDLWEANRRSLAGVGVEQIEVAGICTASRTAEFFSHRAECGKTGRFGAVIALPAEEMA